MKRFTYGQMRALLDAIRGVPVVDGTPLAEAHRKLVEGHEHEINRLNRRRRAKKAQEEKDYDAATTNVGETATAGK